ncbi:hypothetical protein AB5N19_13376 [Seiridium cardinale]
MSTLSTSETTSNPVRHAREPSWTSGTHNSSNAAKAPSPPNYRYDPESPPVLKMSMNLLVGLAATFTAANPHYSLPELLIIASLSTIIFQVIRSQLTAGGGVPLGLLGSGWSFSQVRILDWPVGGGVFWLNGSDAQLWPTELDNNYMPDYSHRCSSADNILYDSKCPSSGFLPLYQHFSTFWNFPDMNGIEFDVEEFGMRKTLYSICSSDPTAETWTYTTHAATSMLLDAMRSLYYLALIYLKGRRPLQSPYPKYLDVAQRMRFAVQTYVPAVRTACLANRTFTLNKATFDKPIMMSFPIEDNQGFFAKVGQNKTDSLSYYKSAEIDTKDNLQQYLLDRSIIGYHNGSLTITDKMPYILAVPVELPAEGFTGMGLVVLNQLNSTTTWNVSTCTIDSRWANGSSVIASTNTENMLHHEFDFDRVRNRVSTELDNPLIHHDPVPPNNAYPRIIRIDRSWYELLAPVLSDAEIYGTYTKNFGLHRSTLERLLETIVFSQKGLLAPTELAAIPAGFYTDQKVRVLEHLISSAFADGLSRCGAHLQGQASKLLSAWKFNDWTISDEKMALSFLRMGGPTEIFSRPAGLSDANSSRREMSATFTGYVMALQDRFDQFCAVLLLLHAALAFAYTIWVILRRDIIEAWDTIPELLALAQNSRPPNDGSLSNTCAGIRNLRTMGRLAVVETSSGLRSRDTTEQLVLRFRQASPVRDSRYAVEPMVKYGAAGTE